MAKKLDFECQSSSPDRRSSRYEPRPLHFVALVLIVIFASSRFLNYVVTQHERPESTKAVNEGPMLDDSSSWMDQMRLQKEEWQRARPTTRKECGSLPYKRVEDYGFNVSDNNGNEWRLRDQTAVEARESLQGEIKVIPGNFFQISDIEMHIKMLSNDEGDLDNLHINNSPSILNMAYSFENKTRTCTKLKIFMFLRPNIHVEVFDVWTTFLDVSFQGGISWEIGNLTVHSSYGNPEIDNHSDLEPLIVDNISVSSIDGNIYGEFIPFGNLDIRTERGMIGAFIRSPFRKDLPFDPRSITMSSISGDIRSILVRQNWPRQNYTHQYKIESFSGSIFVLAPHGSHTNLSSLNGDIFLNVWSSFAANPLRNEIHTSTPLGNTNVLLLESEGPASNTFSQHKVGEGELELRYPESWCGDIEAITEHGEIQFEASFLEDLERGDGYVKAKRCNGESRLEAHVETGNIDILVGLRR